MPPGHAAAMRSGAAMGGGATRHPGDAAAIQPPPTTPFSEWAPAAFARANASTTDFGLYLHTPYCSHRCLFCPFFINPGKPGFSGQYAELLSRDIAETARLLSPHFGNRKVHAVFFGGGTPSDLDRDDLARILRQLHEQFPITPETEITIEGRVRGFTADKAAAWVQAGANRFSIGVQTFDSALRRRMGRLAERDEIRTMLDGLHASGAAVVIDLIYGFPGQTAEMVVEDVRFAAEETPLHGLDLYELREFPGSPMSRAITAGSLPAPAPAEERARMLELGNAALERHGFNQFYNRHWRRNPIERSLYNRMARGPNGAEMDLIPFGSGAGGRIGGNSVALLRDITAYGDAVLRGEKPVMSFPS
jgi:oxygen-independent coproporphyrinogen-3 oxidase